MALIVKKFGGSSVANAERVMNVARIITDEYKAGNDVVVVVSAQGDTTDDLIEKAQENIDIDEEKSKDMMGRMKKGKFDFEDYLESMKQMRKMGSFADIIGMMPGVKPGSLKDAKIGKPVKVVKVGGQGALRRRIMDMGITKNVTIFVRKAAPLGDPIEIQVRGYELSLRKADAEMIEVEKI